MAIRTITVSVPGGISVPGAPNTLTIGTVTTLAAGASATATITGSAPNQTLNLGIPVGATGAVDSTTTTRITNLETTVNAATSSNTVSTLVKRDSTGSLTLGTLHLVNAPATTDSAVRKDYVDAATATVTTNYPTVTGGTNVSVSSSTTNGKTTYTVTNTAPSTTPTYANLPAGTTLTVLKNTDGTWPARPTSRTDIIVAWKGPDPSPAIVVSGTGGMLNNVDFRLVTTA